MNPILFREEDCFTLTKAWKHNICSISGEFGCNIISIKPDIAAKEKLMRYMFEKYGNPIWHVSRLIYIYPLYMAAKFKTPLLVYGDNFSYEYGGSDWKKTYSAKEQLNSGVTYEVNEV